MEARSAQRDNHEFLQIEVIVGVSAAVDHVHHRHGHLHGTHTAQVAIKGQTAIVGCCTGAGHGHTQNGIGAEVALIFRAVVFDHLRVDRSLLRHIKTDQSRLNLGVNVFHGLHDTLTAVARVLVAQFKCFTNTGGSAGRHGSAAHHAAVKINVAFNRGVAAAVQNFTSDDGIDRRHIGSSSKVCFKRLRPRSRRKKKYRNRPCRLLVAIVPKRLKSRFNTVKDRSPVRAVP